MGIEPTTTQLRVVRSTDRTNWAWYHDNSNCFISNTLINNTKPKLSTTHSTTIFIYFFSPHPDIQTQSSAVFKHIHHYWNLTISYINNVKNYNKPTLHISEQAHEFSSINERQYYHRWHFHSNMILSLPILMYADTKLSNT